MKIYFIFLLVLLSNFMFPQEFTFRTENFIITYDESVAGYNIDNDSTIDLPDGTQKHLTDGNGPPYSEVNAPDYVEIVGIYVEYSARKFAELGFNNGTMPNGWNKIMIVDLPVGEYGLSSPPNLFNLGKAWIKIDIDLISQGCDELLRSTCAHEVFHQFQATYIGTFEQYFKKEKWVKEGTAELAADWIFDDANFYKNIINKNWFDNLDTDFFKREYEVSLFWKYLTEQYSDPINDRNEPYVGVELMKKFWSEYKVTQNAMESINNILPAGTSFESVYNNFVIANYAHIYGDFLIQGYDYREGELYQLAVPLNGYSEILEDGLSNAKDDFVKPLGADYWYYSPSFEYGNINFSYLQKSSQYKGNSFVQIIGIKNNFVNVIYRNEGNIIETSFINNNYSQIVIIIRGPLENNCKYSFTISGKSESAPYTEYDNDENTVALWHFNETEGDIVYDSGINGYNGTTNNTNIVESLPGLANAREFLDNPVGFITLGNFNLPQNEGTIEYWIKPTIRPITSCDHSHFFVKANDGGSANGFTFYNRIYNNGDIDVGTGTTGGDENRRFYNAITYNEWNNVAFTWSSIGTKIYVNGSLIGNEPAFPIGIGQTNMEVSIGKFGSLLYSGCRYIGILDEVRISNIDRSISNDFHKNNSNGRSENAYVLFDNYPNPFNATTIIKYSLQKNSKVNIVIYNTLGEIIDEIINRVQEPGIYEIEFNASNLPSGVYLYKLQSDNYIKTKKMILLK